MVKKSRRSRIRAISPKRARAMKRASQQRDRRLVASGTVPPEAMLLLRPDQLKGAHIEWPDPDVPLVDD